MSIQMIALRNSFDRYMRQSEVRIGQLREVVERIQAGEQVDVEKALGTGDAKREADWEECRFSDYSAMWLFVCITNKKRSSVESH